MGLTPQTSQTLGRAGQRNTRRSASASTVTKLTDWLFEVAHTHLRSPLSVEVKASRAQSSAHPRAAREALSHLTGGRGPRPGVSPVRGHGRGAVPGLPAATWKPPHAENLSAYLSAISHPGSAPCFTSTGLLLRFPVLDPPPWTRPECTCACTHTHGRARAHAHIPRPPLRPFSCQSLRGRHQWHLSPRTRLSPPADEGPPSGHGSGLTPALRPGLRSSTEHMVPAFVLGLFPALRAPEPCAHLWSQGPARGGAGAWGGARRL